MKEQIKKGEKPYKLQLVGLEMGGKPIEDYANDFWLISNDKGGKSVGFVTSPWYHPEKKKNIAHVDKVLCNLMIYEEIWNRFLDSAESSDRLARKIRSSSGWPSTI